MNYAAFASSSDHEGSSSSSEDSEVDETLVRELRESLHFCVGKICRAEELAAAREEKERGDNDNNNDDSDDGMSTTSATPQKKDTVMSKEAIAALTELVYHYSTSSLANDLTAFSNHANRRTVKADDVLLVARKEKHILAELKRKLAANQSAIGQSSNKGGNSTKTAAGKKNKKKNPKSPKPLFNSGKKTTTTTTTKSLLDSSSSSSSSDSDIDPTERITKRRLELKQKNLNKTAFGQSARNKNNDGDDDSSDSSSSSDDGLGLKLGKSKKSSNGKKQARSDKPTNRTDTEDDMVIDLQDSD